MSVLVIAEHENGTLVGSTLNTISAALAIGGDVDVLVAGKDCQSAAQAAAQAIGVSRVRVADDSTLAGQLAENMADLVVSLASDYSHILAPRLLLVKTLCHVLLHYWMLVKSLISVPLSLLILLKGLYMLVTP